ncbi:MAG TPA: hypothetical protein VJT67_12650 [Longimicrobiaceae bacterium]|nr:hypothetical protein [Longimicrobiaceae bacterium]
MKVKAMTAAVLGGMMALAGCDGSGTPVEPPPPGFSLLGTWQVHVDGADNCWAAFDARIEFTQASLSTRSDGKTAVLNSEGWWLLAGTGPDHPSTLSGVVDPADASFQLLLWQGADASKQGHFNGSASSATHLTGTFTDPDFAFRTSPGTHPCSSTAHADKD